MDMSAQSIVAPTRATPETAPLEGVTKKRKNARMAPKLAKGMTKYCVLYLVAGRERQSPWLLDQGRAQRAREVIRRRYGGDPVIFVD